MTELDLTAWKAAGCALVASTEKLCALPGIATQDWCQQAAAALLPITDGVAAIAIGELQDGVLRAEASGVAGAEAVRERLRSIERRFQREAPFDWGIQDPNSWPGRTETLCLSPLAARAGERESHAATLWASIGVSAAVVGAAAYCPGDPRRVVVIEIGCIDGESDRRAEIASANLVCLLDAVAKRAAIAYGLEPITATRTLTEREQEVLEHLTLGHSVRKIAETLERSPHTVHDHVKSLHRKLNASSRGQLIARALGHVPGARRAHVEAIAEQTPLVDHSVAFQAAERYAAPRHD